MAPCTQAATLCIQIIRGVYEPFMRDWHAALGDGLLVLRVGDLLDSPTQSASRGKSGALVVTPQITALAS